MSCGHTVQSCGSVSRCVCVWFFFFQAEDGIRDSSVTGVQTCALPIWGKRTWFGRDLIGQDGRIALGYASHLSIYPKDSVIVVILGNIQSAVTDRLRTDVAALVWGEPFRGPQPRHHATPTAAVLEQYAGRYQVGPGFAMTVRVDGRRISLSGPEGDFRAPQTRSHSDFFFGTLCDASLFWCEPTH